jgi:acyl-CoA thioester hydrolase
MMCESDIRVRYADTDQMGVVYYSKYLEYFEVGRTELMRELGIPYRALESEGIYLPVVECSCCYRRSARYDDLLSIRTVAGDVGRASVRMEYEIYRKEDSTLIASGFTRHAVVDSSGKPVSVPERVRERLTQNADSSGRKKEVLDAKG